MKRFKLGVWNGDISYFSDGIINFGLWQEVYQCCKQYGYPFIIENKEQFPLNKNVTKEKLQEFIDDFYKDSERFTSEKDILKETNKKYKNASVNKDVLYTLNVLKTG